MDNTAVDIIKQIINIVLNNNNIEYKFESTVISKMTWIIQGHGFKLNIYIYPIYNIKNGYSIVLYDYNTNFKDKFNLNDPKFINKLSHCAKECNNAVYIR